MLIQPGPVLFRARPKLYLVCATVVQASILPWPARAAPQPASLPRHPALSPMARDRLDWWVWEVMADLRLSLAIEHPLIRQAFGQLSPRDREELFCFAVRESFRRYRDFLTGDLVIAAMHGMHASEDEREAVAVFQENLFGQPGQKATPQDALAERWETLADRIKLLNALRLGYREDPDRDPDKYRPYLRYVGGQEAKLHASRYGERREVPGGPETTLGRLDRAFSKGEHRTIRRGDSSTDWDEVVRYNLTGEREEEPPSSYQTLGELDEESQDGRNHPAGIASGGFEEPDVWRDGDRLSGEILLRARLEAIAQNQQERAFFRHVAEGHTAAQAERLSGLTRGERRGLERRARESIEIGE